MRLLILLFAILATACAPTPTRREVADAAAAPRPPLAAATEADVGVASDVALERVAQLVRVRGFVITDMRVRSGSLDARSTGPAVRGWADCAQVAYRSQFGRGIRGRWTEVIEVSTSVSVRVEALSPISSRLAVSTRHAGIYVNSFTNAPQTVDCPSTGALEQELIATARAGAG